MPVHSLLEKVYFLCNNILFLCGNNIMAFAVLMICSAVILLRFTSYKKCLEYFGTTCEWDGQNILFYIFRQNKNDFCIPFKIFII